MIAFLFENLLPLVMMRIHIQFYVDIQMNILDFILVNCFINVILDRIMFYNPLMVGSYYKKKRSIPPNFRIKLTAILVSILALIEDHRMVSDNTNAYRTTLNLPPPVFKESFPPDPMNFYIFNFVNCLTKS